MRYVSVAVHACRSRQDQLVFALHAAVLTSGYRLVAVGEQAQLEGVLARSVESPFFELHQHCLCWEHCGWAGQCTAAANDLMQACIDQHIASVEVICLHPVLLLPNVELRPCEADIEQAGNIAPAPCALDQCFSLQPALCWSALYVCLLYRLDS
jgi:hypothetical protein